MRVLAAALAALVAAFAAFTSTRAASVAASSLRSLLSRLQSILCTGQCAFIQVVLQNHAPLHAEQLHSLPLALASPVLLHGGYMHTPLLGSPCVRACPAVLAAAESSVMLNPNSFASRSSAALTPEWSPTSWNTPHSTALCTSGIEADLARDFWSVLPRY
eukprot:CAMPEP_0119504882 /NCGR_PEP_ID=MMETSP1344-20130328/25597_1 /TAXON_ID=236787 /ORGANISM="Florenciella parvula, Strain CCMP2471" /LENGTH=159 /DNA_ID=CAMNT_0007541293 /DNA_START=264 /DNA_END=740 /DNA_ORIENTATION=+